ncbi:MAG: tyrosine-type recombinase/integrase [Desulfobacteraceae bacterium]|nr:tyrosine-type recombinase/integrase [Desulfobacteraceae bacterium]
MKIFFVSWSVLDPWDSFDKDNLYVTKWHLTDVVIKVIIYLIFLQKQEVMMVISHTQESFVETLPQTVAANFFHLSNQTGSKKEKPALVEKNGLTHILKKLWKEDIPGKSHIESYLRDQYRRNLRPNSIRGSLTAIIAFLLFIKQGGKSCLEELTRGDLGAFIEHEQDRGLKASTVSGRLDLLKAFVRYQIEKEVISVEVLSKRMIIKVPDSLPKAMEIEDEAKLLSVIKHVRNRAMILLLLRTGMRIGELLNTQVRDIHFKEGKIDIWEAQKTRVGRVVYFSKDAANALKAWLQQRISEKPFIFYGYKRDTLTYAGARLMFCKYLIKANLSHKNYTLHCLRHTNASSLLNAGISLECLRELLGHTSVEVTRRYARLTNKTRENEYFKAMGKIERGEIDGYYKFDPELQAILEKKKLFSQDGKKLHE